MPFGHLATSKQSMNFARYSSPLSLSGHPSLLPSGRKAYKVSPLTGVSIGPMTSGRNAASISWRSASIRAFRSPVIVSSSQTTTITASWRMYPIARLLILLLVPLDHRPIHLTPRHPHRGAISTRELCSHRLQLLVGRRLRADNDGLQ